MIRHNFLASGSILFRNGIQHSLPSWYFQLSGLSDWPLLVVSAMAGDIVLLDRTMGDYILSSGSGYMSKGTAHHAKVDVQFCEFLQDWLPAKWRREVLATKGRAYEAMAYCLSDFTGALQAAKKAFSR